MAIPLQTILIQDVSNPLNALGQNNYTIMCKYKKGDTIMPKSYFNFSGGVQLTRIGACWFVSYMYYKKVDNTHLNWKKVSTHPTRASNCIRNSVYHKAWIKEIVKMNPNQLEKNKLGLSGTDIICMAKVLLPII